MTTMAAIDRLVHHSIILEFDGASQRVKQAGEKAPKREICESSTNEGAAAPNPAERTTARPR